MKLMEPTQVKRNKKTFAHSGPGRSSVGIINLGCARNLVDAQTILGRLKANGFRVMNTGCADTIIVNTCSFVEDATKESVDVILDLIDLKKEGKIRKIIVAGCLAQRYGRQLTREFKEIDAIVGVLPLDKNDAGSYVSLTPGHFAYVKVCESCFNTCSFCTIPSIKGAFVSRTIESVLKEVRVLDSRGVKEINIIGQDITAYGMDIYREKSLARLLKKIVSTIDNIRWIRLLYTYPAHITDELIDTIAREDKICKYLDLPLQHINDTILKRMKRGITRTQTIALIQKIRKSIPGVTIRTTFVVGFPGETDKEFNELIDFVKAMRFECAGVFVYSREGGTDAFYFDAQVPYSIKKKRLNILMKEQQRISRSIQKRFIGQRLKVLIDEKQKGDDSIYIGRTQYDAPEVDGVVYVRAQRSLGAGDFVDANITDSQEYDLMGELV